MSLYVERREGRRPGPVLVFLHHGLGCASLWRDFPSRLVEATGLPGLLYDRAGHGKSPPAGACRRPDYLSLEASALPHLLAATGTRDFILVGHSDGGSIALLYAALPDVTPPRAIVSIASHLFVEPVTRAGIRIAVDAYGCGMRERLVRYHGAGTDTLFWNWAGTWLAPSFDALDLRPAVRRVRSPILAIQGAKDEYGTQAQVTAIAENTAGPFEGAILPDCGHDPHLEAPDRAIQSITGSSIWRNGF